MLLEQLNLVSELFDGPAGLSDDRGGADRVAAQEVVVTRLELVVLLFNGLFFCHGSGKLFVDLLSELFASFELLSM